MPKNQDAANHVKYIIDLLKPYLFSAIITLMLVFIAPFTLECFVPLMLSFFCIGIIYFKLYKNTQIRSTKRIYIIIMGCLFLCAWTWGVFAPFIVIPKPIYVSIINQEYVYLTHYDPISRKQNDLGSLLYIADPIRKNRLILRIVEMLFRDQIIMINSPIVSQNDPITQKSTDTISVIELPMSGFIVKYDKSQQAYNARTERNLIYSGIRFEISGKAKTKKALGSFELGLSPSFLTFLNIMENPREYTNRSDWAFVNYTKSNEINAIRYVALLDATFKYISLGKPAKALDTLAEANRVAPNSLEKLRCILINAKLTHYTLSGNIGSTQSLSIFLDAYSMWKLERALARKQNNVDETIIIWAKHELSEYFAYFGKDYFSILSTIDADVTPISLEIPLRLRGIINKMKKDQSIDFFEFFRKAEESDLIDNPIKTFAAAETKRLNDLNIDDSILEIQKYYSKTESDKLIFLVDAINLHVNKSKIDDYDKYYIELIKLVSTISEPTRSAIIRACKVRKGMNTWINKLNTQFRLRTDGFDDLQHMYKLLLDNSNIVDYTFTNRYFSIITNSSPDSIESNMEELFKVAPKALPPNNEKWWSPACLDWFIAKCMYIASKAPRKESQNTEAEFRMILKDGIFTMTRDGSGQLFVPGGAYLNLYKDYLPKTHLKPLQLFLQENIQRTTALPDTQIKERIIEY